METRYYRLFNDDLKKFTDVQLIVHYNTFSKREKRLINKKGFYNKYPNFDINFYKLHLDLLLFGEFDLIKHYWEYGRHENRLTSSKMFLDTYSDFDCDFYKEIYNLNYLINEQVYIYHWLNGNNEGKLINKQKFYEIYTDFDWTLYKEFNSDLNLNTETEYIKYYLNYTDKNKFMSYLEFIRQFSQSQIDLINNLNLCKNELFSLFKNFNNENYIHNYLDIKMLKYNCINNFLHYLLFGREENRIHHIKCDENRNIKIKDYNIILK